MVNETSGPPRLTPKGERTRARIVEEAAVLIHERGVQAPPWTTSRRRRKSAALRCTTTSPTRTTSCRRSSTTRPTPPSVTRHADLGSVEGVQAWRDMVITAAERVQAKGGCPLGSLGRQLAESDPEARSLIAAGLERWTTEISEGSDLKPTGTFRPASTRMTSPSPCSPRSREGFSSLRYNGAPARSKPRSIPPRPYHRRMSPRPIRQPS